MLDETPEALIKSRQRSYDRRRNLRPLTTGEIIDLSLRIYRSIARPVLAASLPAMLLAGAGFMFLMSFVFPRISSPTGQAQFTESAFGIVVTIFVVIPLLLISFSQVSALTIPAASATILGGETDMRKIKAEAPGASKRMFRALLVGFLKSTGFLVSGLILFLLAAAGGGSGGNTLGILATVSAWVALFAGLIATPLMAYRLSLTPSIAMLEDVSPKESFERSILLVKKHRNIPALLDSQVSFAFITGAAMFFLWVGVSTVLAILPLEPFLRSQLWMGAWADIVIGVIDSIPFMLTIWLVVPLWTIGTAVMYYDRRSRLEAFDISVLADDVLKVNRPNRPAN